jgi:hypothetical protein
VFGDGDAGLKWSSEVEIFRIELEILDRSCCNDLFVASRFHWSVDRSSIAVHRKLI